MDSTSLERKDPPRGKEGEGAVNDLILWVVIGVLALWAAIATAIALRLSKDLDESEVKRWALMGWHDATVKAAYKENEWHWFDVSPPKNARG